MKHPLPITCLVIVLTSIATAEPMCESTDVFHSGEDGYAMYRIPAIEVAPDGTLVAFAEARKHGGHDPGFGKQDIDLVYKTSTDGGKTWSKMVVLEDPGEGWSSANPATVVDRDTKKVWVLYLRSEPGRSSRTSRPGTRDMMTFARYSEDGGKTWSDPIDLTETARDMKDPEWKASIVGPGGAIQMRSGRLVAPIWASTVSKGPHLNCVIYSDDHGKTWKRGECVPGDIGGDEDQVVELADGTLLLDCRQNKNNKGHRWLYESKDGGETWSKGRPGVKVSPVACAIERYTLKSAGDDKDRVIWTGPKGPARNNLVIRVSYDEGKTFPRETLIAAEPAAYSDLTILGDGTIGVLWERAGYRHITFTRLNKEFVEK